MVREQSKEIRMAKFSAGEIVVNLQNPALILSLATQGSAQKPIPISVHHRSGGIIVRLNDFFRILPSTQQR